MYVIDLWSTWCGPCIKAMPGLRLLEERYGDDLTMIAMNVWELTPEKVPGFIHAMRDSMPTHVALDSVPPGKEASEGLTALALLGTAESASIPRTYVIDQDSQIAWIGLAHELDGPLEQIVAGTWNTEEFATRYREAAEQESKYQQLLSQVTEKVEAGVWEDAFSACEQVVAADPAFASRIANQGFAYLAMSVLRSDAPDVDELAIARQAVDRALDLNCSQAWKVCLLGADVAKWQGNIQATREYLEAALEKAPSEARVSIEERLMSASQDGQ